MSTSPNDLPDLPGFELERRLGAGGMAEVFLAKKRGAEGTFKQLVLKRILPQHGKARRFRSMFVEEAELATRLNHPNIVQVYDFSHHGDDLLLSMEYVEGVDLAKLMRGAAQREQSIPPWVAAYLAAEVAKGLHYAHERKDEGGLPLAIVHRDVSPQNVLVSFGGVVKIADFGIASANLFREENTVLKGKTAYMSPEQARGEKADRRSDIYSLGVVLYELICARSPYGALKEEALSEAVRLGAVKPPSSVLPSLHPELEAIVMQALARSPEERFQNARELATAIGRLLLEQRQLIDTTTIEETVAEFVGPGGAHFRELEVPQQTMAAVRRQRPTGSESSTGLGTAGVSHRIVREVRHVALVKLRLGGLGGLVELGGASVQARALLAIRATLDDIAYKRGAVWSWGDDGSALAVVGLLANPSRAADDSALLALDVHEFLTSRSEELGTDLYAAMAIVRGIATGERDEQGHLVEHSLQAPTNLLASALGLHTPFGKTWVAGGIYRLVRQSFHWNEGALIPLPQAGGSDGPERIRVHEMLRPLTPEERQAVFALTPNDLVGRDAERADLHATYHRAVHQVGGTGASSLEAMEPGTSRSKGSGEVLAHVIMGEMGIGKTALVNAFTSELEEGTQLIRVECSPVKIDLPYAVVADLLRQATGSDAESSFADASDRIRTLMRAPSSRADRLVNRLAELITGVETPLHDEDAAAQFHELTIRSVRLLIGALATTSPVVIVLDGLQWADRMSLELLGRVLKRPEKAPVLMLLVTRPNERMEPFLEGMMRSELRGLSADEQVRLVRARLGVHRGVNEVCRELVPRVGGNPYFMLEMLDALLERGALEIVETNDEGEGELVRNDARFDEQADLLPSTVELLVGDRLNELPKEERDIVDWLAVSGGPLSGAEIVLLARLASEEPLTRLCARGLCDQRSVGLDFRHALVRDVAYQALDGVHRVRMHRQLGEHLARTPLAVGLTAAIVAHHFENGEAPYKAGEHYFEAATAARRASQTQLALRYFERAAALLPAGEVRLLPTHDALVRLYRQFGQSAPRRRHLDELHRLAFESRLARWVVTALVRCAQFELDEGAMIRGIPLAERAEALTDAARNPDLRVEASVVLCELLRDVGDVDGALDACDRALQVTQNLHVSRGARGEVLRAQGVLLRRAGRLHAAVETQAEAIAIFQLEGAQRSEARARNALGFALFVLGRYEDSIAMCLQSLALDILMGGRFQVAKTLANIGLAYAKVGYTEQGIGYLARARSAHERYDDLDGWVDNLLVFAGVLIETGQVEEARQHVLDASAILAVSDNVYDRVHCLIIKALLARASGDHTSAAACAAFAGREAEAQALVSYHVYATAIEAASKVDLGEGQVGVSLATSALAAVEEMEGSEYGIEIRSLCCEAVIKARGSDQSAAGANFNTDICRRALSEVDKVAGYIRDPKLRDRFMQRPPVRAVVEYAMLFVSADVSEDWDAAF